MDDTSAQLGVLLARADSSLADADALVRSAVPRWTGPAADGFREAVADDVASLTAARHAVAGAWRAALAHGHAADDARTALLTAAGVAGPAAWGSARWA